MTRKTMWIAPVMVCMLVLTACGSDGPGDVALSFNEAMMDGDGSRAVEHLDPEAPAMIRGAIEDKAGEMAAEAKGEHGDIERIRVVNEEIDGDRATVTIEVTFEDGTTEEEEIAMIQRDGQWYVHVDMDNQDKPAPEMNGMDMPDMDEMPEMPDMDEMPEMPQG